MPKYEGHKVALKRGDGATPTEVFTSVGQVIAIGAFGSTRDLIDVSAYGETWMDFLGGKKEGAEVEFTVAFDPANTQHTGLQTDYDNAVRRNFRVEHAGAAYGWTISTVVIGWQVSAEQTEGLLGTLTVKIVEPGVVGATIP